MRISSIISEYNPFHEGHKYHMENTKKITNSDFTVVIMSGNFTQRGTPAIIDKYTRESGVRLLDKMIAKVMRKVAVKKAEDVEYNKSVSLEDLRQYLGVPTNIEKGPSKSITACSKASSSLYPWLSLSAI